MSFNFKKNILSIISVLNSLVFAIYFILDLINSGDIVLILADFFGIILTIMPLVFINLNKRIKHLYYTTILFSLTGFLAANISCFILSILGIIFSLIPSDRETNKLEKIIKKHPIMAVITVIISAMSFLNSSSLFEYFSELTYGFDMLGELIATLFLLFLIFMCKKSYLIYKNNTNAREAIMVSLPFIIYIMYIGSSLLAINLAEGYSFVSIDNIIVISILYLLVGIFEDFLIRGLSLNILLDKFGNNKKGIWLSIVISSLAFGLIHLTNIFTGASLIGVIIQVISATFIGFYFSALYLRSGSVWTTAILHGLYDLAVSIPSFFAIDEVVDTVREYGETISNYSWGNVIFSLIFVFLAIFLLRNNKLKNVISIRNGKELINNKRDILTRVVIIGFSFGIVMAMCYTTFISMFELNKYTKDIYGKILTSSDYQQQYGLTYINGVVDYGNMPDTTKILLAINNLKEEDFDNNYSITKAEENLIDQSVITYVSKDKIDKSIDDIFGRHDNIKYVSVDISFKTNCSYDENISKYICVTTNNNIENNLHVYSNINTIDFENIDTIEVEVYYLVEDINTKTIYADSNLKTVYKYNTTIEDLVGDIKYDQDDSRNREFWDTIKKKNNGKVPTYKLSFVMNEDFSKALFDKSEFLSNSIEKSNSIKESIIDSEFNNYSSNKYSFKYNKKYFTIKETEYSLSLNYNNVEYLKIERINSDDWLNKYKNTVGNNISFGNNIYYHYGNEYMIYKDDFYIITIRPSYNNILNNNIINTLSTLEFKEID